MANTDIMLISDSGEYVPSTASLPVVSGDTFSFTTSDGGTAYLFFSPAAAAVVSPKPVNPVKVSSGQKAVLTFMSSTADAYSIFIGTDPTTPPANFPAEVTGHLLLKVFGAHVPIFGIHDNMTTGH